MPGMDVFRIGASLAIVLALIFPLIPSGEGRGPVREPTAYVSGMVSDGMGTPIEGAVVRIVAADWSMFIYAFSNSTGHYSLNTTYFGNTFIECEMSGYLNFRRTNVFLENGPNTIDITLKPLPSTSETVDFHVDYESGGPAEGVLVLLEYSQGEYYYSFQDDTGTTGDASLIVFPASYDLQLKHKGFTVHEDHLAVMFGEGPYEIDVEVPMVPDAVTRIKGYVLQDVEEPLEGVIVVVVDQVLELQQFAATDQDGFFEMDFWDGKHILFTMIEGYEMHFSRLTVPAEGEVWANITIKPLDTALTGTVLDPSGSPVEGISVSFLKQHVFVEQSTAVTDENGEFSMNVSSGEGFLVVAGDDPFEGGEYDLYLEAIDVMAPAMDLDIQLTDVDMSVGENLISFGADWDFTVNGTLSMPLNNSRYMRRVIDMMIGNADQVLEQEEFDEFYELMIMEDDSLQEAPFGIETEGNFTIDGLPYDRDEHSLEFKGITGSVEDLTTLVVEIDGRYSVNGTVEEAFMHTIVINMTYDDERTVTEGWADLPAGWLLYDHVSDLALVEYAEGRVTIEPSKDPDPDDDEDSEFVTLLVYSDELGGVLTIPNSSAEGGEVTMEAAIADLLPENEYTITWDFGDGSNATGEGLSVDHTYEDDGEYPVSFTVSDRFGRTLVLQGTMNVTNLDPVASIVHGGPVNLSMVEGGAVALTVEASDVGSDHLFVAWSTDGTFDDPMNYTDENATFEFIVPDDGNHTVWVRVTDEDGGSTVRNVTVSGINADPTMAARRVLPRTSDVIYEMEYIRIVIDEASDPSELDILEFEVSTTGTGTSVETVQEGAEYRVAFTQAGTFDVTLTVSDDDGGARSLKWTIVVSANGSLDHDGDGIPMDWEEKYGLSDSNASDASADEDEDGLTNLEEFEGGSDPLDEDDPVEQKDEGGAGGIILLVIIAIVIVAVLIFIFLAVQNRRAERIEEE